MNFEKGNKNKKKTEMNSYQENHLELPKYAILICIDDNYDNLDSIQEKFDNKNALNVDFYDNVKEMNKKGNKNNGEYSFVISPANERLKYTTMLRICTSVVISGLCKETKKNISIITHQTPRTILEKHDEKKYFKELLRESLSKFKSKCIDKSIDVVIVGGKFETDTKNSIENQEYEFSLKTLEKVLNEELKFNPLIIEPLTNQEEVFLGQDIYFDTPNRRLYVFRTKTPDNQPFNTSELREQE